MGLLTLTYPTLSATANKAEVETDLAEITTVINGGLDNSNLAASAGIETSKLAARDYEFLSSLNVQPTTAVQPPSSSTVPIAICGLPGTSSDGAAYTVISGTYLCTDPGTAGNTAVNIQLGYLDATTGTWTTVSTIVASFNIAGAATNRSGAVTIGTSAITLHASIQYFLGLFITAYGDASTLDSAHSILNVTLKLRRTSGLR
jgi:hypothetical protein